MAGPRGTGRHRLDSGPEPGQVGRGLLAAPSSDLEDALTGLLRIRDEHGLEIFYNFAVTPWASLGADLQVIKPSLADDTAVFLGLRMVTRF